MGITKSMPMKVGDNIRGNWVRSLSPPPCESSTRTRNRCRLPVGLKPDCVSPASENRSARASQYQESRKRGTD